jgi:hypothetical protein
MCSSRTAALKLWRRSADNSLEDLRAQTSKVKPRIGFLGIGVVMLLIYVIPGYVWATLILAGTSLH